MIVGEAVTLEYKMAKGESLTYKTTVHTEQSIKTEEQSGSSKSDVEMTMVQKCTDVSAEGIMTIDVTIQSGKVIQEGESQELSNIGQTITLKMKKSGEVIHTSVDLPFEQPAFPTKSVKKGESWTSQSKISIPGKTEMVTLNYNYSLWDFNNILGFNVAEIKVSCPETKMTIGEGIEQVLTAKGTTYFAHKEGRLIKSEIETKTIITAQDGTVDTNIKVAVELENNSNLGFSSPDEMFIIK